MSKERTKFALLSLLSALVIVSTAFVGVSIYAQTDDSELTTFEEEAQDAGAQLGDTGLEDDATANSTASDNATSTASNDTMSAVGNDTGATSTADVSSLFDGLVICDVGDMQISNETQTASAPSDTQPTVSVEVMTRAEVSEQASNTTETASANNTSVASANCIVTGGDNATSTASGNATDGANATSTASNETSSEQSSFGTSNETSISSAAQSEEILVIGGQDFSPGQVVLIFTEDALIGIDDVAEDGSIEAKVPVPAGQTTVAGNDTGTEIRFVESGTQRTATFDFDGQTLTASTDGEIQAEGAQDSGLTAAPSSNATSTTNSTGTNFTGQ